MHVTAKRHRRSFTLVELLVVVAILGLLAAIVTPVVYMGLVKAKQAKIQLELASITASVERYKTNTGSYPPDFMGLPALYISRIERHLSKAFPRRKNPNLPNPDPDFLPREPNGATLIQLTPAETLVFWLRGFTADREHPLRSNMPMKPIPNHPIFASPNYVPPAREAWFVFDESRLIDADGNGFPEYYPPGGMTRPYVYFDSRTYFDFATQIVAQQVWDLSAIPPEIVKPYASDQTNERFANPKQFQVISAGLDDNYGSFVGGAAVKSFPSGQGVNFDNLGLPNVVGQGYVAADRDNLTNFSEGSLGDAMPQ